MRRMTAQMPNAGMMSFMASSSAQGPAGQALSLGLVTGSLAALGVILGASGQVQADECFGIPSGSCGWGCESSGLHCNDDPPKHKQVQFCHDWPTATGCYKVNRTVYGSCACA